MYFYEHESILVTINQSIWNRLNGSTFDHFQIFVSGTRIAWKFLNFPIYLDLKFHPKYWKWPLEKFSLQYQLPCGNVFPDFAFFFGAFFQLFRLLIKWIESDCSIITATLISRYSRTAGPKNPCINSDRKQKNLERFSKTFLFIFFHMICRINLTLFRN